MKIHYTKRLIALILIASTMTVFSGCQSKNQGGNDIYIVYTGDIHCADDENIGYAGLGSYCDYLKSKSENVVLVDTGDAIQGDYPGTITKGEYIIDMMNLTGYDFAVLGNHEFDYGVERLSELIEKSKAQYLACNISYIGNEENLFEQVKAYTIKDFGTYKVGFVGVSTPNSITSSTPTYFMEENEIVYDFAGGDNGNELFSKVQKSVDTCREEGADFVVVMTHLGDSDEENPYSSRKLIATTKGIDAVLDGHDHHEISCAFVENSEGKNVLLSSTGEGLNNIGTLIITESGNIMTGMVSDYAKRDDAIRGAVELFNMEQEEEFKQKIAYSNFPMSISEDEIRIVRTRETTVGNLAADAFRSAANSDIAILNGGGIREDLPEGEITYGDVRNVMPFQNTLCSVKATGNEIADALEYSYRCVENVTSKDGEAVGEIGGFLQVSGLKCSVDTSVQSSVSVDDDGMFLSVDGKRRVSDIQILKKDGTYVPLELNKEYTVASVSYLLKNKGDGYSMFADNEFEISEGITDYQVLIDYIKSLGDNISDSYASTEGRIIVK